MISGQSFNDAGPVTSRDWRPDKTGQLVILDNRDSFVFNLAHRFYEVGRETGVVRSDQIDIEELERLDPSGLVVSPGPGHPDDAGISVEAIRHFAGRIPMLGVCLGHQAIAVAFGGSVQRGERPVHGMASRIDHDETGIFDGIAKGVKAGRYHSLAVTEVPDELIVNARADGFVMGLRHRRWPIHGVQFHPESVLTGMGRKLLANFCRRLEMSE